MSVLSIAPHYCSGVNHLQGRGTWRRRKGRKSMRGFKVIPLCQVGPNGEDRLITGPPGDEWVGLAVTPDWGCWWADLHEGGVCRGVLVYGNQGPMNNTDKYLGACVVFAREQVCSSRVHAGTRGGVKTLMPWLHSRGHSALTTWSVDRSHLKKIKTSLKSEMLAPAAQGRLSHLQSTRVGLILETAEAGSKLPGKLSQCCVSWRVADRSPPAPASSPFRAAVQLPWDGPAAPDHWHITQLAPGGFVCG